MQTCLARLLGCDVAYGFWRLRPDDASHDVADWLLLDARERERQRGFLHPADRRRFLQSHAGLRRRLAAALDADAASLLIRSGQEGKPYLPAHDAVDFSLSHSGDWAAFALSISGGLALGIDIEVARTLASPLAFARHQLPCEAAQLAALPRTRRQLALLRCWTGKEAVLKALGHGLLAPLDSFTLQLDDGGHPIAVRRTPQGASSELLSGRAVDVKALLAPEGVAAASIAAVTQPGS